MARVLTTASSVSCDHPPTGGGIVTLVPAQTVLKIEGKAVLVADLSGSTINSAGCAQRPPPPSNKPCSCVVAQAAVASGVLKVNGKPVLLDDSSGLTDGKPDQAWSAKDAGQKVLSSA